jgi:hypothetical protein
MEKPLTEFHKKKNNKDFHHNTCKECRRIERKEYCKTHKKEISIYNKKYKKTHKIQRNLYEKNKKENNVNYKIIISLRIRINKALHNNQKKGNTIELLGCSIEEFKKYLETKFLEGMDWDNYGIYGWHIDHIKPCSLFNLENIEEQKKCFHYTNLQPLWAIDNLKKGNKYD